MTTQVAIHTRVSLGVVLVLVAAVLGGRMLAHNELSSDDIFFFDAARQLLEGRGLSLGIWGNARLHEDFLASYPPLGPLPAALNVWLVEVTGSPYLVKSSGVVLALCSAALLYVVLPPLDGWRSIVVLLALVEPVAQTFYLMLRPEALILPLMLALYVASARIWRNPATARFGLLGLASILAILTHWQFAVTLGYVIIALGLAVVRGGTAAARRAYAGYIGLVAAVYGAYAGWMLLSAERSQAFAFQMLTPAGDGTALQRAKFAAANVLAGDLAGGSGFSIYVVAALVYLALRMLPSVTRDAAERRGAIFTLGFLVASLLPAVYVAYLGPRAIPVYLVAVVVLMEAAAARDWRGLLIGCVAVAAVVNVGATAALGRWYFGQPWSAALIGMPVVWMAGAFAVAVLTRRHRDGARLAAATAAVIAGLSWMSAVRADGPVTSPTVLAAAMRPLDTPLYDGRRVLCDVREHYLALWLVGRADRIFSTFPLLYFDTPADFERFTSDMQPAIVLLSEATRREMQHAAAGRRLADWLTSEFELTDRFALAGRTTEVYVRR